ncbi:EamA family transporter [Pseudoalteromonas citrea]|uniref:EamA family transporter n=1 Tax=Pseudoalteromonas citrea TaxID=43655 RepID=A0A5S3XG52_9GAMM|nr:DMT family transporter [Pseudoalteromonas citrea]TMP43228.1 EamA family transporter [Pseudoalteromonas citrea]TMP52324.1 EamA family transporter [Pseudoalteromonas citrea]
MKSILGLLLLAAIWGGSFLFIRILVTDLGPILLMELRVLLGALFLCVVGGFLKQQPQLWYYKKHYLTLGCFNSALPFLLFAYAAQTLNASLLAILNSTAPFWGVLIGAIYFKDKMGKVRILGCLLGLLGVITLVWADIDVSTGYSAGTICATLGATLSYAIASHYTKLAPDCGTLNNAQGSLWGSVILIFPLLLLFPYDVTFNADTLWSVLLLGVVCTGAAYILYFKLIATMGAQSALSVTFLIPLFGMLWGYLVLDETLTYYTVVGGLLILLGVGFVTGVFSRVWHSMVVKCVST